MERTDFDCGGIPGALIVHRAEVLELATLKLARIVDRQAFDFEGPRVKSGFATQRGTARALDP